jgi:hypothetical protein
MFEAHKRFESFQVVITSYDVLRNDIDLLETISFNYCILDEGHIIKNPKTKITQSVKRVVANNRLLLSGTPIQVRFVYNYAFLLCHESRIDILILTEQCFGAVVAFRLLDAGIPGHGEAVCCALRKAYSI